MGIQRAPNIMESDCILAYVNVSLCIIIQGKKCIWILKYESLACSDHLQIVSLIIWLHCSRKLAFALHQSADYQTLLLTSTNGMNSYLAVRLIFTS